MKFHLRWGCLKAAFTLFVIAEVLLIGSVLWASQTVPTPQYNQDIASLVSALKWAGGIILTLVTVITGLLSYIYVSGQKRTEILLTKLFDRVEYVEKEYLTKNDHRELCDRKGARQ